MYVEVNADWIYNNLRKDLRDHLGYDGVSALLEWYESCETEENKTEYDIALFWCWDKGTLEEVFLEHNSKKELEEFRESYRSYDPDTDEDGEVDEEEFREALKDSLRREGRLVAIDEDEDLWLYSE